MSSMKMKLFALLCAAVILAGSHTLPVFAAYYGVPGTYSEAEPLVLTCTEIPLYIDNEYIGPAIVVDSVPYVPLLAFTECMLQGECQVEWDQETGTATLVSEVLNLTLTKDQNYMIVNGRYLWLEDGAYNVNGTLLVPLRAISKVFSLELSLDLEQWAIRIDTGNIRILDSGKDFYDATELYWLSRAISSEAGNQSLEGMIGVGDVILNRMHDDSGAFSNDIISVLFQSGQFDVVRTGAIYAEPRESAVIAAKLCLDGCNLVGDCMWFVNPSIGLTNWFDIYTTYEMTIGDHLFYS